MKFKVGDRVRVSKNFPIEPVGGEFYGVRIGKLGTIKHVMSDERQKFCLSVMIDGMGGHKFQMDESELEPYTKKLIILPVRSKNE